MCVCVWGGGVWGGVVDVKWLMRLSKTSQNPWCKKLNLKWNGTLRSDWKHWSLTKHRPTCFTGGALVCQAAFLPHLEPPPPPPPQRGSDPVSLPHRYYDGPQLSPTSRLSGSVRSDLRTPAIRAGIEGNEMVLTKCLASSRCLKTLEKFLKKSQLAESGSSSCLGKSSTFFQLLIQQSHKSLWFVKATKWPTSFLLGFFSRVSEILAQIIIINCAMMLAAAASQLKERTPAPTGLPYITICVITVITFIWEGESEWGRGGGGGEKGQHMTPPTLIKCFTGLSFLSYSHRRFLERYV